MSARAPESDRSLQLVPTLILLTALAGTTSGAQERSPSVLVRQVIDGDTIVVAGVGRVGLLGIDAPEIRPPAQGSAAARQARERLEGLVANRWVRLEYDGAGPRSSAYVFLEDGRFVNAWLVHEGLATVTARRGLRRLNELKTAEAAAQAARRGLWRGRS